MCWVTWLRIILSKVMQEIFHVMNNICEIDAIDAT